MPSTAFPKWLWRLCSQNVHRYSIHPYMIDFQQFIDCEFTCFCMRCIYRLLTSVLCLMSLVVNQLSLGLVLHVFWIIVKLLFWGLDWELSATDSRRKEVVSIISLCDSCRQELKRLRVQSQCITEWVRNLWHTCRTKMVWMTSILTRIILNLTNAISGGWLDFSSLICLHLTELFATLYCREMVPGLLTSPCEVD